MDDASLELLKNNDIRDVRNCFEPRRTLDLAAARDIRLLQNYIPILIYFI
jgi:hypothetical protein